MGFVSAANKQTAASHHHIVIVIITSRERERMSRSRDREFLSPRRLWWEVLLVLVTKSEKSVERRNIVVIEGWRASSIVAMGSGGLWRRKNRERTRFSMVLGRRPVGKTRFYIRERFDRVKQERTFDRVRARDDGEHRARVRFARVRGRFEERFKRRNLAGWNVSF